MKTDIHPTYHTQAKVTCACGNTFTVGSTKEDLQVEICAACHPFYTGKDNKIDSAGRMEKFKARVAKKATVKKTVKKTAPAKDAQETEEKEKTEA